MLLSFVSQPVYFGEYGLVKFMVNPSISQLSVQVLRAEYSGFILVLLWLELTCPSTVSPV